MAGYETLATSLQDGVFTLCLNRPQRLNAFTRAMHAELGTALDEAEGSGARALILTGAGRAFCSGQDLTERAGVIDLDAPSPDLARGLVERFNPLILRMRALPFPTVAAVNGVAAGAGVGFALACDLVLAARSASFLMAFARIGLVPDAGGSFFALQSLGRARATAMMLLAEPLPAEAAEAQGLIWRTVDDAALPDEARAIAMRLAAGPTESYRQIRRLVDAGAGNDLAAQLAHEAMAQGVCGRTRDYREGVAAFLEKRTPVFSGGAFTGR
jgi:2-(1,2-epoxy-1,2-dihydrophenyl)acetyl-CoA isomerase